MHQKKIKRLDFLLCFNKHNLIMLQYLQLGLQDLHITSTNLTIKFENLKKKQLNLRLMITQSFYTSYAKFTGWNTKSHLIQFNEESYF